MNDYPLCIPRYHPESGGQEHNHNFQPRYSEIVIPVFFGSKVKKKTEKTYVHDVCIYCGMIVPEK